MQANVRDLSSAICEKLKEGSDAWECYEYTDYDGDDYLE